MGVYNPYEQMPTSCRGCKYCKNDTNGGFSGHEATYDYEYCDLLKVKLFDHLTEKGKIKFYREERYAGCPLVEIKPPHGDLKDFSKISNWHVIGLINDPETGNKVPVKCKLILESDWNSVLTLIEAEE